MNLCWQEELRFLPSFFQCCHPSSSRANLEHLLNAHTQQLMSNPVSKNRVNKANPKTPAAKWNRDMLRWLGEAVKKDPEVDIASLLSKNYSDKLKLLKGNAFLHVSATASLLT